MAFNTGNPIGSTDARDLSDNAQNFDQAVNQRNSTTWTDRLGVTRKTVFGAFQEITYKTPVAYATGLSFLTTDANKTVEESGIVYAPLNSSLPFTTSGTFSGDDDARFYPVQDKNNVIRVTSITDIQDYSAPVGYVFSLNAGGRSGTFDVVAGDFSTELAADTENGVYVGLADNPTASNKVAKRRYDVLDLGFFGVISEEFTDSAVEDNTQKIEAAFKFVSGFEETYPDVGGAYSVRLNAIQQVIKFSGIVRYTSTITLPAGVRLESAPLFFDRRVKDSLFYDPVDLNTAAVITLNYKQQLDGSFAVNRSIDVLPLGEEFDSGLYVAAATHASFSCSLVTAPGVKLGVAWIGAAGSVMEQMCIGENSNGSASALIPDVGFLQVSAWGCTQYSPRILARKQGVVYVQANAGSAWFNPYIARNGSIDNDLGAPPYVSTGGDGDFNEAGAQGVALLGTGSVTFYSPVIEHFWHTVVAVRSIVAFHSPHFESTGGLAKHSFVIDRSLIDVYSPTALVARPYETDPSSSWFLLKDCFTGQHGLNVYGELPYLTNSLPRKAFTKSGGTESTVNIAITNYHNVTEEFAGDIEVLREIPYYASLLSSAGKIPVYVSATGDNNAWGFSSNNPVQTMREAAKRVALAGGDARIVLRSNISSAETIDMKGIKSLLIDTAGYTFTITGGYILCPEDSINITMRGDFSSSVSLFRLPDSCALNLYLDNSTISGSLFSLGNFVGTASFVLLSTDSDISAISSYAGGAGYGSASIFVNGGVRNTGLDAAPVSAPIVLIASDFI